MLDEIFKALLDAERGCGARGNLGTSGGSGAALTQQIPAHPLGYLQEGAPCKFGSSWALGNAAHTWKRGWVKSWEVRFV